MTKFEEFILTEFVPKNSKMNDNGTYEIDRKRIEELNLNPKKKALLIKTLSNYQIGIIDTKAEETAYTKEKSEDLITKVDRSPLVRDLDYGQIASIEREKYDETVYSTIEYNQNGTPVFENYEKLEKFLDKDFIPNCIQTKKVKDKETGDIELYSSIQLNKLTKLKLSEQELKHAIEFLEERDIRVAGINSTLDSEFGNYDYVVTYKAHHLPVKMSWEEQRKLFEEYSQTKNEKIREKLIVANMRLVPFITFKMTYTYNADIEELNGYGYEALVKAFNKFDLSKGCRFSTFAYTTIRREIYRNLPELLGWKNIAMYRAYNDAIKAIEEYQIEQGIQEKIDFDSVCDLIAYDLNIPFDRVKNEIKNGTFKVESVDQIAERERDRINSEDSYRQDMSAMNNYDIAEETGNSYLYRDSNNDPSEVVANNFLHDALMEVLDTLTDRESDILKMRSGLHDGREHTLNEVGYIFGITHARASQIENKAIRKLRHPQRAKKIRDFY